DVFAAGKVWISTLDACRRYEGEHRGDPGEGKLTYNTGFIRGDGDNPSVQKIARRIGVNAPRAIDLTLSNNRAFHYLDAWVLCYTECQAVQGLNGIGRYCVRIERAREYFETLTATFSSHEYIREAIIGRIVYKDRSYHSLEYEPGRLGFV